MSFSLDIREFLGLIARVGYSSVVMEFTLTFNLLCLNISSANSAQLQKPSLVAW